jgi:transcriptional regulator of NAD metabolism
LGADNRAMKVTDETVKEQLTYLARRFNIEREKFEHDILGMLEDILSNENPEKTNKIATTGLTSSILKF